MSSLCIHRLNNFLSDTRLVLTRLTLSQKTRGFIAGPGTGQDTGAFAEKQQTHGRSHRKHTYTHVQSKIVGIFSVPCKELYIYLYNFTAHNISRSVPYGIGQGSRLTADSIDNTHA